MMRNTQTQAYVINTINLSEHRTYPSKIKVRFILTPNSIICNLRLKKGKHLVTTTLSQHCHSESTSPSHIPATLLPCPFQDLSHLQCAG